MSVDHYQILMFFIIILALVSTKIDVHHSNEPKLLLVIMQKGDTEV
jgi:hypothetical protein